MLPPRIKSLWLVAAVFWGCDPQNTNPHLDPAEDSGATTPVDTGNQDTATNGDTALDTGPFSDPDTGGDDTGSDECDPPDYGEPGDPFADAIVSFSPGKDAGFGQDELPDIVLGPPLGGGASAGSLDVLSLGEGGEIILEFTDRIVVDGPGIDLLIFENPFPGWLEPGLVAVSEDGKTWHEWSCDVDAEPYTGCAGVGAVLSHPDNCIDATDPTVAGGDGFDLAELGLSRARFVRIRDLVGVGQGSFDLDAISIVNDEVLKR